MRFIVNSIMSDFCVYNIFLEVNNTDVQGEKEQIIDDHCDLEKTAQSELHF